MRNQKNDEGRVCVTAGWCWLVWEHGWFGSMAALSDGRATWLSQTPGRPGCWARGMRDGVARPFLRMLASMSVLRHDADLWLWFQLKSPGLVLHFYFCLRTSTVRSRMAVAEVPVLLACDQ